MKYLLLYSCILALSYARAQQGAWQQNVNYDIHVTLDDEAHFLHGNIKMEYKNNAPHPVDSIYIHLWPNAYSTQQSAFAQQMINFGNLKFYDANPAQYGHIDSLDFETNNGRHQWMITSEPDIGLLTLENVLQPGETVEITTPFRVKIPHSFSRLGHTGQAYQITQWFPKPAVYDHNGHHPMPYLHIGEFYSEFGDFNVHITLPRNYVVGATGKLQNEAEHKWLSKKAQESQKQLERADSIEAAFQQNDFPPSASEMKTLHFKASNVHDFAWFADKRYYVLTDSIALPAGNKIQTKAMFTGLEAILWRNATQYISSALTHYSELVGNYPYPQFTAVEGALSAGAGMEYPMVTIIGRSGSSRQLERVVAHEVGHIWFYGILGFNERAHPWMDEGINSYYEYRYFRKKADTLSRTPNKREEFLKNAFGIPSFTQSALMDIALTDQQIIGRDQPAALPADYYPQFNYAVDLYHKPARYFEHLEAYLGKTAFDSAMSNFYNNWKFTHPGPEDLRNSLEQFTGKNLDWFFDGFIKENNKVNNKLLAKKHNNGYEISVKRKSASKATVHLAALKNGKVIWEQWATNEDTSFTIPRSAGQVDEIVLDPDRITLETNRQDDLYRPHKLFKRTFPPIPHLFGSIEQRDKKMFYLLPAGGWNKYDQAYMGLAMYNNLVPRRGFHYRVLPAYSFYRNEWIGAATVEHNLYFENEWLRRVRLAVTGQTFNESDRETINFKYQKLSPSVMAIFDKLAPSSHFSHQLRYRYIDIRRHVSDIPPTANYLGPPEYDLHILSYKIKNDLQLLPWENKLTLEAMPGATKLHSEAALKFRAPALDGFVELRVFGGIFIQRPAPGSEPLGMNFTLSNRPGYLDYTFDELFLGRNEQEGIFYQQQVMADGGFKVRTDHFPFGMNNRWLSAANLSVPVPKVPLLWLFADAAFTPGETDVEFHAESGIAVRLVKDMIEVYFPVLMTRKIKQAFLADTDNYWQRITFQFNFSKLNPVRIVRELRIDP